MRIAALVLSLVGWCLQGAAWGAAGDLDPSFGTGGVVLNQLSTASDQVTEIAVQPDGMIVVGGDGFVSSDAIVARYDSSGVLDPTFGTAGIATLVDPDTVGALVLQPDGKIVVAGPSGVGMLLTRLDADGGLDTSFGSSGIVEVGLDVGFDRSGGLVLQPDGKIVAGGTTFSGAFGLARFHADGSVDSAFGAFGIAETPVGTDGDAELFDVVLQPDGKLVAGGEAYSSGYSDFGLARFDADGQIDPTFGTGGTVTKMVFGPTADERIIALVLQPDGKIVAAGHPVSGPSAYVVARFNASGSLDTGFGPGGMQIFGFAGNDFPEDLAISPSGRLLVSGESGGVLTIARINSNGFLDSTFGSSGVAQYTQPPLAGCCSQLHAIALQADGRIVAGGYTLVDYANFGFDIALIRVFGGECGNGTIEPGEDCELTSDCCSATCDFSPAGTACSDDGLVCTRNVCDAAGACTHPGNVRTGCTTSTAAAASKITIRDDAADTRDALVWRWRKGPALPVGALGDPLGGTSYTLCGFDASSALLFQLDAPAGGTCAGAPCWRARGTTGFAYRDRAATPTGTTVLTAITGPAGRSRAVVKGKGTSLTLPALPLATPVRVQLQATNGFCIDTTFSSPDRNDAGRFRAKQ